MICKIDRLVLGGCSLGCWCRRMLRGLQFGVLVQVLFGCSVHGLAQTQTPSGYLEDFPVDVP